jgi:selenide,water dikinase
MRAAVLAGPVRKLLAKPDAPTAAEEAAAVASMTRLNRDASRAAARFAISAGTDVTGFGLVGHLLAMLEGSGVAAELRVGSVPLLPGARRFAETGPRRTGPEEPRGEPACWETSGDRDRSPALADAQMSGGLLLAVSLRLTRSSRR